MRNSKVQEEEEEGGERDHSSQSYQLTYTALTITLCLQRKLRHIAVPPYGLFCPSTALGTTMLSNPLQPVLCLISDRQFPSPGQSKRDPIKLPRPSRSLHITMPYGSCMKLSRPQVMKGIQHMLGLSMTSLDVHSEVGHAEGSFTPTET